MIALNRAIAVSFAEDPESALPLLDALAGQLADYAPFHRPLPTYGAGSETRRLRARPTSERSSSRATRRRAFLARRLAGLGGARQ